MIVVLDVEWILSFEMLSYKIILCDVLMSLLSVVFGLWADPLYLWFWMCKRLHPLRHLLKRLDQIV